MIGHHHDGNGLSYAPSPASIRILQGYEGYFNQQSPLRAAGAEEEAVLFAAFSPSAKELARPVEASISRLMACFSRAPRSFSAASMSSPEVAGVPTDAGRAACEECVRGLEALPVCEFASESFGGWADCTCSLHRTHVGCLNARRPGRAWL